MGHECLIPYYQFRSNSIIIYDKWEGPKRSQVFSIKRSDNIKKQRESAYSGKLTKQGKKRLEKAITLLVQYARPRKIYNPVISKTHYHKLSFVTLTIADNTKNYTAAETYKSVLRPLLQWLTKYKGVKLYVWKAELQKRGQIHYHLITPSFIHYQELRDKWNRLQAAAGYLDQYYKEHNHNNPNSTDIHSCKKIRNVAQYLIKYLSKEEGSEAQTKGKTWDCSQNLKATSYFKVPEDTSIRDELIKVVDEQKADISSYERFSIARFKIGQPQQILSLTATKQFYDYLNQMANSPPNPPPIKRNKRQSAMNLHQLCTFD